MEYILGERDGKVVKVYLCVCGCGRELSGSTRQRRSPECRKRAHLERQKRHRDKRREDPAYKKAEADRAAARYNANPDRERERMRERARINRLKYRIEAIKAYGGACACCGS